MNIHELLKTDANVMICVRLEDLKNFMSELIDDSLKQKEKEKELLSQNDVCQLFNITKPTLWRWKKEGILVPRQIGRQIFYNRNDINKILYDKEAIDIMAGEDGAAAEG